MIDIEMSYGNLALLILAAVGIIALVFVLYRLVMVLFVWGFGQWLSDTIWVIQDRRRRKREDRRSRQS